MLVYPTPVCVSVAGYVIKSGSVLTSYAKGQSSAPFDVLCKEECEAHVDCNYAHVFTETFEHHDLAHQKPPPPSPPPLFRDICLVLLCVLRFLFVFIRVP